MSGLPSYLTSGASSRPHHAFLNKLHGAQAREHELGQGKGSVSSDAGPSGASWDEEPESALAGESEVVRQEAERCLRTLVQRGTSQKVIAETLIILLHTTFAAQTSPWAIPQRERAGAAALQDKAVQSKGKGKARADAPTAEGGLHGSSVRRDEREDVALVAALHLATGSKVLQEKRTGYLYLAERLPAEHKLCLMFINTIRKDLTSEKPPLVVLALHAIIKTPSAELAPAVVPILTSKGVLRHAEQKCLQALTALHFSGADGDLPPDASSHTRRRDTLAAAAPAPPFPLSMGKVARLLDKEQDPGVVRVVLELVRRMVETGSHHIASVEERAYLLDLVMLSTVADDREIRQVSLLEGIRCIAALLDDTASLAKGVDHWLCGVMRGLAGEQVKRPVAYQAILLEICGLLRYQPEIPRTLEMLLNCLGGLLAPRTPPSRSASSARSSPRSRSSPAKTVLAVVEGDVPHPNEFVLVARCLTILPVGLWDGKLSDQVMGIIMSGLGHPDDAVRKATLRLLWQTSPDEVKQHFDGLLQGIADSKNIGADGGHAVDIIEVQCSHVAAGAYRQGAEPAPSSLATGADQTAERVLRLFDAVRRQSRRTQNGQESWEEGFRRVLAMVNTYTKDGRVAFLLALDRHAIRSSFGPAPEVSLLRAALTCELAESVSSSSDAVEALFTDVESAELSGSNRELGVIALASLLSCGVGQDEILPRLNQAAGAQRQESVVRERIQQVIDLCQAGMLQELAQRVEQHTVERQLSTFKMRSRRREACREGEEGLPEYFALLAILHMEYQESLRQQSQPGDASEIGASPGLMGSSKDLSASRLRYDAYAPPPVVQVKRKDKTRVGTARQEKSRSTARGSAEGGDAEDAREGTALLFDSDQMEAESSAKSPLRAENSSRRISDVSDPFAN